MKEVIIIIKYHMINNSLTLEENGLFIRCVYSRNALAGNEKEDEMNHLRVG